MLDLNNIRQAWRRPPEFVRAKLQDRLLLLGGDLTHQLLGSF